MVSANAQAPGLARMPSKKLQRGVEWSRATVFAAASVARLAESSVCRQRVQAACAHGQKQGCNNRTR